MGNHEKQLTCGPRAKPGSQRDDYRQCGGDGGEDAKDDRYMGCRVMSFNFKFFLQEGVVVGKAGMDMCWEGIGIKKMLVKLKAFLTRKV
jgi:hypothetical protein